MSAPTVPATRVLPSPSDPAWNSPATFAAITYWADTICPAAHAQAHPNPVQGCPGCPPVAACAWCGLSPDACPDLAGHRRVAASGETPLSGVAR